MQFRICTPRNGLSYHSIKIFSKSVWLHPSLAWKRPQVGLLRSPLTCLDRLTANRWRSLCAENRLVYTHQKIVQKSLLATTFFPDTRLKKWTRTLWQRHWCVTAMYLHVWMSEWTLIILSVWVLYLADWWHWNKSQNWK